ncbi:hypothetical protein B0T22DRAFT_222145 [Podospora appendiculata]|uniref:Uncharacterized protein n=1 Tax=Podospora appendiculata TaxID=314037 RepID=A0AAE1CAJ1_9PEZI|nr:hypothetical protein B0T22DRAFT_222145 [Podospora appendiculata]
MPADPKHAGRKRSLRQKIRSLGQLGLKTEEKGQEQQAPFQIVHTPDRPGRLVSPLEAPTEEDCAIDIKSWQWAAEQQEKINRPLPPKHLGMFRYGAQIPRGGQGERGPDTGYLSAGDSSTRPLGPTPGDSNESEYDESYAVDRKQLAIMEGVRRGLCPHCRRIFTNPAAENCPHCRGDLTQFRVYRPPQVPQSIHIQLQQQDEGSGRSSGSSSLRDGSGARRPPPGPLSQRAFLSPGSDRGNERLQQLSPGISSQHSESGSGSRERSWQSSPGVASQRSTLGSPAPGREGLRKPPPGPLSQRAFLDTGNRSQERLQRQQSMARSSDGSLRSAYLRDAPAAKVGPGSVASTAHSTELGWWGKLPDNPEVTPSPSELTLVLPSSVGPVSGGPPSLSSSTISKLSSMPDLFGRDEIVPRPLASERFKQSMAHANGLSSVKIFATVASIPTKTSNSSMTSNSSSGSNGTIRPARADEVAPREPERRPSPPPPPPPAVASGAGAGKARAIDYNKPLPPITQHQRWQTTDQRAAHERMIRENGDDADLFMNIYDNYSEPRS